MEVTKIADMGKNIYSRARTVAKGTCNQVKKSFKNPIVRSNAKNALPVAILTAGAFSAMSLLPNRKGDGKQGKLEKMSGKLASYAFAIAGFTKFFKVPTKDPKELEVIFKKAKIKDVLETLNTNKENIVAYIFMILGVRVVTNLLTKGLDEKVIEEFKPQKLGD